MVSRDQPTKIQENGIRQHPGKKSKAYRNCGCGPSSKNCNVVSDRVDTFQIYDMMIAIGICEKRIKSSLSSFGFLDDLTSAVRFLWATGFSNKSFCFLWATGFQELRRNQYVFSLEEIFGTLWIFFLEENHTGRRVRRTTLLPPSLKQTMNMT